MVIPIALVARGSKRSTGDAINSGQPTARASCPTRSAFDTIESVSDDATTTVDADGWSVIRAAVHHAGERLGDELLSAYAIGSLAHGGFAPAVSDVDLALLTTELDRDMNKIVTAITAQVAKTHRLGERLSVFHAPWETFAEPPPSARFPPIDRFDLVRYGVLVHGADLRITYATPPSADEIRAHAVDSALRRATRARLAADLKRLKAGGITVHDATKLVLWPIRLQHVCDTGQATGNADAVDHYLALSDAAYRSLAHDALSWRDLATIPKPDQALQRITNEIHLLHAEVFQRLGERADIPRHDELARRARRFGFAQSWRKPKRS